ncbi:MAG TPA: TIR domain-containing protein [Candidatus Binatia bacterium]|nr:TIR domain-containing protein [Candidatus Binatia bacterium]
MKYWAFLSYSHADEAAATKLHRALESYTLPASVRKAHGLPRRLIPVFRDVEELEAAAGLTGRLEQALDGARWLILLCSPAAAKSKYVNAEVEYFLRLHGPDKILCVLAEGEPPDCFPPAIRALKDEPLAADLRAGADVDLAILKLISAMAVIGFTELRNREAQRRKRQRLLAAAGVAAVSLGALTYWDLFHRELVSYCSDYELRWGVWTESGPLSLEAVGHRNQSYRFVRFGRLRPPVRVDIVSGKGACKGFGLGSMAGGALGNADSLIGSPACSATFTYAEDGALRQQVLRNRNGAPREEMTYVSPEVAQFTLEGYAFAASRTGIYYAEFKRAAGGPLAGLDQEVRFFQSRGNPRPDGFGHFGYAFGYDPAGRLIRTAALDANGRDLGEIVIREYDDAGHVVAERLLDGSGNPRQEIDGCYGYARTFDRWGNTLTDTCLDAAGQPGLNRPGFSSSVWAYDEFGNVVLSSRLGPDGRPVPGDWGYTEQHLRYDDRGFEIERAFFNGPSQPATDEEGAHRWEVRRDERGNALEYRYFDSAGRAICIYTGVCQWRLTYDPRGNVIAQDYFDTQGKPQLISHGAGLRVTFDALGLATEVVRLGLDGKPYLPPDLGCAIVTIKRDERGLIRERHCLDAQRRPHLQNEGYASSRFVQDEVGNVVEVRHFGVQGKPTRNRDNFAVSRARYDRLGRKIEEAYFDEHEQPIRHRDGYFARRSEFDMRGRETQRRFYDANLRPASVPPYGHFGVRYERLPHGEVTQEILLDAEGRPRAGALLARIRHGYDSFGRELERRSEDGAGKLVPGLDGCALFRSAYDSTGRVLQETCLDAAGKPALRKGSGWARHVMAYDTGRKSSERFFDAAGKSVEPQR